ncbi:hypothetical protein CN514_12210 [Bacillus sp. AFS001701]|nr:hypothetical protein CN514_12210 [Bacillus sp. AFS001701]
MKEKILQIHRNNNETIESFKYFDEEIEKFVQIYTLKNKLTDQLSKIPIMKMNRFELQSGTTSKEEVLQKVDQLYSYIDETENNIDYQHFSYFQSILNDIGWLNKPILNDEYYWKIEQSYNTLKVKFNENIMLYDRNMWYYCQIKFAEIKKRYVN